MKDQESSAKIMTFIVHDTLGYVQIPGEWDWRGAEKTIVGSDLKVKPSVRVRLRLSLLNKDYVINLSLNLYFISF